MATISDVAKAAGVSPMTVSNVLNGHPHVRDSTRIKVLDAMARLDYSVNVAARNLRKGRTGVIGLAVPEVNRAYYGQFAAAVIAAAERRRLRVSIEQTGASREHELAVLALSRNRLYDGLILGTVGMGPADAEHLKVPYPVVIIGERIFNGPVDHVAMPNVDGARAATRHLIDRGCRRIAMLTGSETEDVNVSGLRLAGYRLALQSAGLPELVWRLDRISMDSAAEQVRRAVADGADFDGVFCLTDTAAMGALRALADLGIRVPAQVKLIGFDNIDEGRFLIPSLSTIDPDHPAMAERAVDLLVQRIEQDQPPAAHEEFVSQFTLMARESTAA